MPVDDYWGSESTELEVEEAVEVDLNGNPVVPTAGRDIPKSIIEAEGDLIVGREAGAPERLPAGDVGQALVVAADGGLEWDTPLAAIHSHDEYATDADLADHLANDHAGLATDAELAAHEGAANPHPGYLTPAEGDAAYAPVHAHPYAPTSHSHVDADIPAGIARDSEVTAAVSAHEGAGDPHPTYETSAEAAAKITAHEGAANPHPTYATDADLTAHTGAADPHPTYETSAEAAAKITTHEGAADPHAGYLKESEVSGFATPAIGLSNVAGAGSGTTAIRANSTIAAFDATAPTTQAFGDAAAVGSAGFAARRDHKHAMPANPVTAHEAAADPHAGYVLESLIDAAGDLIVGTADNTPSRVGVGTNGQVLTVDTTLGPKVKWATPAAGGGATITQQTTAPASPVTNDLWIDTDEATQVGLSSIIAYAERTTDQNAIGAEVDIASLTVTVSVPAGRRLRLTAQSQWNNEDANAGTAIGFFKEGSTYLGRWSSTHLPGAGFAFGSGSVIISPSAGTHTYKVSAQKFGTGTMQLRSPADYPAFLLVEDITGTLWPAGTPMVLPPRVGWHLTRAANQSIALDTLTNISWDTEVQDTPNNFTPHATTGTTLTIPSGGGGLWAITFQAEPQAALASMQHARLEIVAGGMTFKHSDNDDVTTPVVPGWCLTPTVPLNDGDTIICKFIHSATAAVNFRGRLLAYRIGS